MIRQSKLLIISVLILFLCEVLPSCHSATKGEESISGTIVDTIDISQPESPKYTEMELKLIDFGLVDVAEVDSTIGVFMVYATPDNWPKLNNG